MCLQHRTTSYDFMLQFSSSSESEPYGDRIEIVGYRHTLSRNRTGPVRGDNTFARLFQNLRLRYHTFARIFSKRLREFVCATFFQVNAVKQVQCRPR